MPAATPLSGRWPIVSTTSRASRSCAASATYLSLAVYDALDAGPFAAELEGFAAGLRVLPVTLAAIDIFTQQGVLYLAPVVTEPLLQLHRRFHETFAASSRDCWEHYHPTRWVPHVTLAMETEERRGGAEQALSIVRRHWHPGPARLDAIALDRFYPVETLFVQGLS